MIGVAQPGMRLGEAAKLVLLSFDSTLRSNLSVGLLIDLVIYERDSLDVRREKRISEDDEYFRKLSSAWSDALRSAFAKIESSNCNSTALRSSPYGTMQPANIDGNMSLP